METFNLLLFTGNDKHTVSSGWLIDTAAAAVSGSANVIVSWLISVCVGLKLESEFPVQDLKSGQGGLLQVCMEGIGLLFANTKVSLHCHVF